jgi:hypothetical protein
MDRANNLKLLNAESYDDWEGTFRDERREQQPQNVLPFGVTGHPRIRLDRKMPVDAEDHDSGPRGRKPRTEAQSLDDEEELKGKARGRPSVNPKDETDADVSVEFLVLG